jgi:hypothetical protein
VSLKSLPSAAGDLLISGPPVKDLGQEGEDMAARGLVRADLASLSDLDRRALLKTGPPSADASEEHKTRVKEPGSERPWEIDLSEVMCMSLIASGAFGSVYYGTYRGKEVAVKFLNPPAEVSDRELAELATSFQSEVGVWHGLSHPNIVQVRIG